MMGKEGGYSKVQTPRESGWTGKVADPNRLWEYHTMAWKVAQIEAGRRDITTRGRHGALVVQQERGVTVLSNEVL